MVGDSPKDDVKGAKQVGIKAILIARNNNPPLNIDTKPDFIINNLIELKKVKTITS